MYRFYPYKWVSFVAIKPPKNFVRHLESQANLSTSNITHKSYSKCCHTAENESNDSIYTGAKINKTRQASSSIATLYSVATTTKWKTTQTNSSRMEALLLINTTITRCKLPIPSLLDYYYCYYYGILLYHHHHYYYYYY